MFKFVLVEFGFFFGEVDCIKVFFIVLFFDSFYFIVDSLKFKKVFFVKIL